LNILLGEMKKTLIPDSEHLFSFLIVNDGSLSKEQITPIEGIDVKILNLVRNLGHQKAIASGLGYIRENINYDKVLILDADGEDSPADAKRLLQASISIPDKIILGQRTSRQETNSFRFFYRLYKTAFRLLTGRRITFGNFMVIPKIQLEKLVYYSEIWSHLAGGILKSGLPFSTLNCHRGKRYAGNSKMSFHGLLMHGLGAIAVFIETIAGRLLVFSLILIGISLLAILALVGIKFFTNSAIPGWTSTVMSAMLIILLQSFLLSLFTIFLYLSSQSQRKFIPALHYKDYTGSVESIQ
jgi:hypothetical protein